MPVYKAKMNIKYGPPNSFAWLSLRWGTATLLLVLVVLGGLRYLMTVQRAGALDFSTHLLSGDTAAVGVLGIEATDIDDDGDIDVITCGKDGLKVYEQKDNVAFEAKIIDDKPCERVMIADFDKDGATDLLITMLGMQPSVRWYHNTGNIEFSGTAIGTGSDGIAFAGDIDADGAIDIVTATTQSTLVVLERWMNNGSGSFTSTQLSADSGVRGIGIGDIDGNGYPDIVTSGTQGLQRWGTSDGYTYSRVDIDDTDTGQRHLVVADVNLDNKLDIVVAEPGGNQVIYYRNLDQRALERIDIASDLDAKTVAVVDLDEDGDEDVLVAAQDDNLIVWLENDGSDSFTRRTIAEGLQSIFGAMAIDLDNDNDFDVLGGNHMRGTVYWYERVVAKPVATKPADMEQSTDGKGIVTFSTTISDGDFDATRMRILYSLDGVNWYKPWLTSATPSVGAVNLKNSHGYQVGTNNAIDTNSNSSVKVTMKWDTKSAENTGGPVRDEQQAVRLRIIPRDAVGNGLTVESDKFEIDNGGPRVSGLTVNRIDSEQVMLKWGSAIDNSAVEYRIYYGIDSAAVLTHDSEVWDSGDDAAMSDSSTSSTTITGLTTDSFYTFKLVIKDTFGNETSLPSVSYRMVQEDETVVATPSAVPDVSPVMASPVASPSEVPVPEASTPPTVTPEATLLPSNEPSPLVSPSPSPISVERDMERNLPPRAEAGNDMVVNNGDLVILDGTASRDPEGALLTYNWRQVVGKPVILSSSNTATPSFTAEHEDDSYVFALTVRDISGSVATDSVTVVTRPPLAQVIKQDRPQVEEETTQVPFIVSGLLGPANYVLLLLSILVTGIATQSRMPSIFKFKFKKLVVKRSFSKAKKEGHVLRLVDAQTGRRLSGVRLVVKGMDDKVWNKTESSATGEASVQLPVGQYRVELKGHMYTFSPAGLKIPVQSKEIVYTGGNLQVKRQDEPMRIIIPLKRTSSEVKSWRMSWLKGWQFIQRRSHMLTWPVYFLGASLNTVLLLWVPQLQYLVIEVIYIGLVLTKVWLELKQTPSYGVVRDAISRVPLDLAVVRLYEEKNNKLVLTRATNGQGKFFALPPSGTYTVTVTKPGYATFTKHGVSVSRDQSTAMQIQTDLMPVIPKVKPLMAAA